MYTILKFIKVYDASLSQQDQQSLSQLLQPVILQRFHLCELTMGKRKVVI